MNIWVYDPHKRPASHDLYELLALSIGSDKVNWLDSPTNFNSILRQHLQVGPDIRRSPRTCLKKGHEKLEDIHRYAAKLERFPKPEPGRVPYNATMDILVTPDDVVDWMAAALMRVSGGISTIRYTFDNEARDPKRHDSMNYNNLTDGDTLWTFDLWRPERILVEVKGILEVQPPADLDEHTITIPAQAVVQEE